MIVYTSGFENIDCDCCEVIETNEGYKTPVGVINAPIDKILDFLCDLGYKCIKLKIKNNKNLCFKEKFEWMTPNCLIDELKDCKESKNCGAIAFFVGFVREVAQFKNKECKVISLNFEVYEKLYDKKLKEIYKRIEEKFNVKVKIFHKIGKLKPGENIVYVAVMGKSRKDVWNGIIEAVEAMKKDLPIWKKETLDIGDVIIERWI